MTTDHTAQLEQQITRAWQLYVDACLEHQPDAARLAMAHVDRLLDRLPRPRTAQHDQHTEVRPGAEQT